MRVFKEGQDDGGQQANSKDPPRPSFDFSISTPDSSRHSSVDLLSFDNRWANKANHAATFSNVPVMASASIKDRDALQSWSRETRQFVSITAMHGVKRIWQSKGKSKALWSAAVIVLAGLMFWQVADLVLNYANNPTSTQVSLVMTPNLTFPKITICNFNPVKQSYLQTLNATGDFPPVLVQYLLLSNSDITSAGDIDQNELEAGDSAFREYTTSHPGFTVDQFYEQAGFSCSELFKWCSFGGKVFNCCEYVQSVLTAYGICHYLSQPKWNQAMGSETSGLQLILDAHKDEKVETDDDPSLLLNPIDAGFRFYVDEPEMSTYSTSQGVAVSPGDVLYSAVSLVTYKLLEEGYGSYCRMEWPDNMVNTGKNTLMKYQSKDCTSKCKAEYANRKCSCSPFIYNIDFQFPSCSPLQNYECVRNLTFPDCTDECPTECNRILYDTSNSYGRGFSDAAIAALKKQNKSVDEAYIRANYLSLSIFFRELSYTQYEQVASSNLTTLLSAIGGTLGLFLGMSVLTVFESLIYATKVCWTFISCQRRRYTANKEREVKNDKCETERTVKQMKRLSVMNLEEIARNMRGLDTDTASSICSRQNSWTTFAEKEDQRFISIPIHVP